jgi:hypothetical protein
MSIQPYHDRQVVKQANNFMTVGQKDDITTSTVQQGSNCTVPRNGTTGQYLKVITSDSSNFSDWLTKDSQPLLKAAVMISTMVTLGIGYFISAAMYSLLKSPTNTVETTIYVPPIIPTDDKLVATNNNQTNSVNQQALPSSAIIPMNQAYYQQGERPEYFGERPQYLNTPPQDTAELDLEIEQLKETIAKLSTGSADTSAQQEELLRQLEAKEKIVIGLTRKTAIYKGHIIAGKTDFEAMEERYKKQLQAVTSELELLNIRYAAYRKKAESKVDENRL